MKLQVLQESFTKVLILTQRFTSFRNQLPVLGNVLLSAQKTRLSVSSTNLEVSISTAIGAKIEKEGDLTVPAKTITELVANLPSENITLESEKENLKISTANFSSRVSGMNASDFPKIPQTINKKLSLLLPREKLIEALTQVVFAASIDETRPLLTGVLFIFGKGELTLVATDGFRLSQKRTPLAYSNKNTDLNNKRVILPKTSLNELLHLESEEEAIYFSFNEKENQAVLGTDEIVLATRTLEGVFPDFEKIIPKDALYKISLDKDELLRAVKLASVFARESANIVKLTLQPEAVEVSGESQSGSQKSKVDAKREGSLPAEGFEIAFNYRFLEEFLHATKGEEVLVEFSNTKAPGVFRDPKDPNFLHLIMPVSIQG